MKKLLIVTVITLMASLVLCGIALADSVPIPGQTFTAGTGDELSGEVGGGTWTLKNNILTFSGPVDMGTWELTYDIEGSEDIEKVVFGPEVSYIYPQFCSWVAHPTAMEVDPGNPNYKSVEGVIYSKDGTVLVRYPAGKTDESFTVPEHVSTIGQDSFTFVNKLRKLILQEGVTAIEGFVFNYCDMEEIDLPASLQSIGQGDFRTTESLQTVNYAGTIEQWKAISIGSHNTALLRLSIHCTDGDKAPEPETGSIGANLTYELNYLTGSLVISGTGSMYSNPFTDNMSIVTVRINEGATNISYLAFAACRNLQSVEIPDSVTEIGYGAFSGCESLIDVTIPASVINFGNKVFDGCTALRQIGFGGTVEEWQALIENTENSKLSKCIIVCKDGTLEPDQTASGTCGENLTWTLNIQGKLLISGEGAMYDYDAEDDAPWCYDYRDNVKSVEIEDGVTSIGGYAFRDCVGLETVKMADTVNAVGLSAFGGCSALKDVSFSGSLTEIEAYAFCDCQKLSSVTFPAGLERIGMAAFAGSGLVQINIEGSGTDWDFFYSTEDGSALYHINLPATVTEVGEGAFCYCSLPYDAPDAFTPSDLNSIGTEAFADSGVRYVWLSDGVTEISDSAFAGCASLEYIFIPYGCNSIGEGAFPSGTTLLGYDESSIAAAYAEENGCVFLPLEDPFGGNG